MTLVVGASGATGRLLVRQLLEREEQVKAIVRSPEKLAQSVGQHQQLSVITGSVLSCSDAELAEHVAGCDAVALCLGHNITLAGIYGKPRRLVTDSVRRLCAAVRAKQSTRPTRFVLMNTAGNSNRDLDEPIALGQRLVIGLLRLLLPPHVDNEQAADFLRTEVGQSDATLQWVVVRPDNLIDQDRVCSYDAHPSPTRSAIFDPGTTSRINVGHFMAELICHDATWQRWQGQMPVIYNTSGA